MKPTKSKDGRPRFTMNIKYRAGFADLANAVAWHLYQGNGEPTTRRGVLNLTRDALRLYGGSGPLNTEEDIDDADARARARAIVAELFPDLDNEPF